jgi:uncharacterized protein YjbJ (UPF0337 family)
MSGFDDIKNKAEELGGQAKEAVGNASGDQDLQNEGKADQVKSDAKQKFEDAKDQVTDKANEVIGKFKDK